MEEKEQNHARIIKADGITSDTVPEEGKDFTLAELQNMVGGLIQPIVLNPSTGYEVMIVNEEGLLYDLPDNPEASRIVGAPIVGDAVLLRYLS